MKIAYFLYRLAGGLGPKIPPVIGYPLCRLLGGISYHLNQPVRTKIELNLRRIMGPAASPAEIKCRTRATFDTILYNYFDLFRLPALTGEKVDRLVTIEGWEHVEAVAAQGKGLIMTSAHLGNMEVVLYAMLRRGLSITIPVERVEPPELFQYISALRMSQGLKLIPVDGPLLELSRTLKKGGVVGLAGDRDVTGTGQVVNFFGYPARLPDGHIRLALRTGTPLVAGFSRRNPDQTYHARFLPAFYLPTAGTEEERVAAGLRFIVTEMEKAISQNPEQWVMTVSIWVDHPS